MNHQTEAILERAKATVDDEGVFTPDQIHLLHRMIDDIGRAIGKEADCNKGSVSYGGHGFG